jgi:hypothetical protein
MQKDACFPNWEQGQTPSARSRRCIDLQLQYWHRYLRSNGSRIPCGSFDTCCPSRFHVIVPGRSCLGVNGSPGCFGTRLTPKGRRAAISPNEVPNNEPRQPRQAARWSIVPTTISSSTWDFEHMILPLSKLKPYASFPPPQTWIADEDSHGASFLAPHPSAIQTRILKSTLNSQNSLHLR